MSSINTTIKIKGTKEELDAILEVLTEYSTTMKEEYENGEYAVYLDMVQTKNISSDEIAVEASGPYGCYDILSNTGLFHTMAESAPAAYFKGCMDGFITGATVRLDAELKNGELFTEELYLDDYWEMDFEGLTKDEAIEKCTTRNKITIKRP